MDILKKIFPLSFKLAGSVVDLIIGLLIYIAGGSVLGALCGLLAHLPIVNLVAGIISGLIGIYVVGGIVLLLLAYFKVLKD